MTNIKIDTLPPKPVFDKVKTNSSMDNHITSSEIRENAKIGEANAKPLFFPRNKLSISAVGKMTSKTEITKIVSPSGHNIPVSLGIL